MKKIFVCLSVFLLLIFASAVFANVMPFSVSVNTTGVAPKITYRLNETCSAVTVQIYGPLPDTTVIRNLESTPFKGYNQVFWDGKTEGGSATTTANYGFRIIAVDNVGHTTWNIISNDAESIFQFESPRGCAVNKNSGDPYFGMVYITNTRTTPTASGRLMGDGIYALYPDGSDPLSIGTVARSGGINWGTSGTSSPYHLFVGPDGRLWIADWSDSHGNVFLAEPDLSGNFTMVFDTTGQLSSGLVAGLHGSVSGVYVEGTGTQTVLYTQDEDLPAAGDIQQCSIWKYPVGNGPFPWTTAPTVAINDSTFTTYPGDSTLGILVNSTPGTVRRDSAGNWYVANYRSAGTDYPCLVVFDSTGSTLLWDSLSTGNSNTTPDPIRGMIGGFALDENHGRMLFALTEGGPGLGSCPLPLPLGNLSTQLTLVPWASATPRAIDLDAVGNVYITDSISELLRVYSPPDGPNNFVLETNQTVMGGSFFVTGTSKEWMLYE
jgi:hypothetical protein